MTEKQNLNNEDLKEVSGGTISYGKYVVYTSTDYPNLTSGQQVSVFANNQLLGLGIFVSMFNNGFKLQFHGVITSIDQKERKLVLFQDGRNCSYKIGNNGAWHFIPYEDGDPINKF